MKRTLHKIRRGFTLIELSIAMTLGLITAGMVLAVFNQQLAFLRIYQQQNFLTEEAQFISMYVSRIIGDADRYRLHASINDATAGNNPRLTASPVLLMNFRQPDGTMRATLLAFEVNGQTRRLNYYVVPTSGVLGAPQWSITNKAQNVEFTMQTGVLRMTLTGPRGEQITYSGTMQQ